MNNFVFSGRLGREPEASTTAGGHELLKFSVANDVGYGENKKTQWIDCVVWGKRGAALAQHLTKGIRVVVAGEVNTRAYVNKSGEAVGVLCVNVKDVDIMFESNTKDEPKKAKHTTVNVPWGEPAKQPTNDGDFPTDNDIPF